MISSEYSSSARADGSILDLTIILVHRTRALLATTESLNSELSDNDSACSNDTASINFGFFSAFFLSVITESKK